MWFWNDAGYWKTEYKTEAIFFAGHLTHTLKNPCRGFYVSQNILPTSFEIDQIQNNLDIGNWLFNFQEVE
jgi:hypothetical protein